MNKFYFDLKIFFWNSITNLAERPIIDTIIFSVAK